MLYYLLYPLREFFFGFNVFRYLTFRAAAAAITAFVLSALLGKAVIAALQRLNVGEKIRPEEEVGVLHQQIKNKQGTPTMGGVLIVGTMLSAVLLWADLSNRFIWITVAATLWLALIGFIDDFVKLRVKGSRGLSSSAKMFGQLVCGLVIGFILLTDAGVGDRLDIPFLKNVGVHLGSFYAFFTALVIISTSNAVNLTDGLDGLAIGCVLVVAVTYAIFSYLTGNAVFSEYLHIIFIPPAGELSVFCAAMFGAGLGFLWYNCHPADVFMGDTGSLALGGAIGTVAVLIKKELLLALVGGVFVAEALSVLLQVISFRYRKKRIFLMSPLHHHFQLLGWAESKIIFRFLIVAVILALLSFSTLKLR
ncbi:MAG: phospho-N-acetylmuramoyl-pentapeptide-transferase [Candidatus Omnitrophica bacterium]|nr:phospho-N-acetylmuramoyl-pentapeptide-transferase [Candidatus Omnitrophota bacterium]